MCYLSQLALRDQYGYELTENISKGDEAGGRSLYLILKRLRMRNMWRSCRGGKDQLESIITCGEGLGLSGTVKEEWFDFTAAVDRLIVSKESN